MSGKAIRSYTSSMSCAIGRELELEAKAARLSVDLRHGARRKHLACLGSQWDDELTAFVEQAAAEAEIRSTEARRALEEHAMNCCWCATCYRN